MNNLNNDDNNNIVATEPVPQDVQLKRSLGMAHPFTDSNLSRTQTRPHPPSNFPATVTNATSLHSSASTTVLTTEVPDRVSSSVSSGLEPRDVSYRDTFDNHVITVATPPSQPIVRCVNIHKTYLLGLDGVPALRGINLSIERGEFIIILGKSGGGKTSLLNILGTIDKPSKGELYLANRRITSATTDDEFARIRLRNVGFVFQQFNLISTMTALENVSLPMTLVGNLSHSEVSRRAQDLLDTVGIGARSVHLPSQLSGGEQQRVTIARAISNHPDILLLDEPTGDLDTKNGHLIMDMLVKLNREEGITCVMVTHDNDLVAYAHRVVHMLDGKILKIETIDPQRRADKEAALKQQIIEDGRSSDDILLQRGGVTELRDSPVYYKSLQVIQQ